jgi:hypothetical protein
VAGYLLSQGADVDAVTIMGDTPLRARLLLLLLRRRRRRGAVCVMDVRPCMHAGVAQRTGNVDLQLLLSKAGSSLRPVRRRRRARVPTRLRVWCVYMCVCL